MPIKTITGGTGAVAPLIRASFLGFEQRAIWTALFKVLVKLVHDLIELTHQPGAQGCAWAASMTGATERSIKPGAPISTEGRTQTGECSELGRISRTSPKALRGGRKLGATYGIGRGTATLTTRSEATRILALGSAVAAAFPAGATGVHSDSLIN